jgi:holo-[acyl-carrier protein] synthase
MDRHPDKFVKRIFSTAEITASKESSNQANYFAKRFAVKEAVYKALSMSGVKGCGWREAETLSAPNGAPMINLTGRCKTALVTMTPGGYKADLSVSMSDEPPYALAFIVISAVPAEWIKT